MIGLSPLTTGHPRLFQQTWVRSSSTCYRTFNLPMARSLGFGSNPCNSSALFRLAFAAPTPNGLSLLQRLTRWPIIQKVRGDPSEERLPLLVGIRFQVYFTPRGAFHLSLTVLVHYRSWTVFSLTGWCRQIHTGFLRSRVTQGSRWAIFRTPTGLSPSMALLSRQLRFGSMVP